MKPLALTICVALAGLCLTGKVHASQPTMLVPTPNSCVVLMGGGGMVFPSDYQNREWFLVGRVVTRAVAASLQGAGYNIYPIIVDVRSSEQRLKLMGAKLVHERCNQVVQITHSLSGESATQPGVAKDFAFTVTVFDTTADDKLAEIYSKTYSYPLTREIMDSLSMSGVGRIIATDIENAKVLTWPVANATTIGKGG